MTLKTIRGFKLELEGADDAVYGSGEVLSGRVVLELNREIKVRSLTVHGRGVATAHWLENRSVGMNTAYNDYTSKETYFRKRHNLIRDDGDVEVLHAGRHEFPFSFQLPEETLVTSFEGKHGSVRYWVKAKLRRPWSAVRKVKKEFTVIQPVDINTPALLEPQVGTRDKMARVWYRNFGQVSVNAKIDRKGYTPGEVIPVFAEFENSTCRAVVPRACITQIQTFMARGTTKQRRSVVAALSGDPVEPRRREAWHGHAIKIPPVGPTILQSRIIRVEYVLLVSVDMPGSSKLSLELPLVMGTIPLHPFCSRTSSVSSQGSLDLDWLRMASPDQLEAPPDYSAAISEEDETEDSVAPPHGQEDFSGALERPLLAFIQEFRYRPPPVYCVVDPNPQPLYGRPRCMTC